MLGHPFGTCQMTLPGAPGARGFVRRIDVQNDPRYFGPLGALCIRIEEAQIGHEMFLVVTSQDITLRSLVVYRWIEWRRAHVRSCSVDWLDKPEFALSVTAWGLWSRATVA